MLSSTVLVAQKIFTSFYTIMNISPISNYKYSNTNFKANARWIHDKAGKPLYKTTTYFFRDDIDWKKLVDFLCNKYKNATRVNVLNHACSNGMEPYTFIMQLLHSRPNEANKFFPITAKDLNEDNIYAAKLGRCGANISDMERAQLFLNYNLWHFTDWQKADSQDADMILNPKNFVKEKVLFSQGNIFDDIENLPQQNNIVLCRNMLPYLNNNEQQKLLQKFADKLDKTSVLVMGNYDFCNDKLKWDLDYYGFKEVMPYVFTKNC